MADVVVCRTGLGRHAPDLPGKVSAAGGTLGTVECFDRCETCERWLLCRIDGATTRFRSGDELVDALETLRD